MASGRGSPRVVGVGFVCGLQASTEVEVTGLLGFVGNGPGGPFYGLCVATLLSRWLL